MSLVRGFFTCWLLYTACCTLSAAPVFTYNEDDFKEAQKSAEKGDVQAQTTLGIMYDLGQGVPQNFTEALKWYKLAAARSNAVAQNNLGVMYLIGEGVPQNYFEASKWIQLSADQGYARAEMNLGFLYTEGDGVRMNYANALYWLGEAANQGDSGGERALGNAYADGKIVNADYIEAYKWLTLAAAQGDDKAIKDRDELAGKMNSNAIAVAQKEASEFIPKKQPSTLAQAKGSGTGFFITKDGYMLTANHVVDGATKVVVKTKFVALAARVIRTDTTNDLALLKIIGAYPLGAFTNSALLQVNNPRLSPVAANFRPFNVNNSSSVKLGDSVATLGFPNPELQGSAPKFTRGEINSIAGIHDDPHYFQISAPIQPGNSGGPLLNNSGEVVGIIQLTLNDARQFFETGLVPQNVNYALKSSYILSFIKSVPAVVLNSVPPANTANPAGSATDWVSDSQSSIAVVIVF
jgi:S1-C subfamily serine protease